MENIFIFVQIYLMMHLCLWWEVSSIDISQKYFSDVSISCKDISTVNKSEPDNSGRVVKKRIWLLPNGGIFRTAQYSDSRARIYVTHLNDTSALHIKKIDDVDFGVYWCIEVWNDFRISAIKHTVNLNGPPMHEFYQQQKERAIIGGISAGVLLCIIILTYIVWYFQCSEKMKRKRRLTDDLAKGINRYSTQIYDNVGMDLYVKRTDT